MRSGGRGPASRVCRRAALSSALAAIIGGAAVGLDCEPSSAAGTSSAPRVHTAPAVTVTLPQGSQPGRPGTAVLEQRGRDVIVTIDEPTLRHATRSARIVKGSCAAIPARAAYRLAPVVDGRSRSRIRGTTVGRLVHDGFALVIAGHPSICGELGLANFVPLVNPSPSPHLGRP